MSETLVVTKADVRKEWLRFKACSYALDADRRDGHAVSASHPIPRFEANWDLCRGHDGASEWRPEKASAS